MLVIIDDDGDEVERINLETYSYQDMTQLMKTKDSSASLATGTRHRIRT